jgi:putative endonuclease
MPTCRICSGKGSPDDPAATAACDDVGMAPSRPGAARIGAEAETLVSDALTSAGWLILGRNVRLGRRELDLVAVDPGPPAWLVVVEVRWRRSREHGYPEETLDHAKRVRLREGAGRLAATDVLPDGTPLPRLPVRVDLVAVEPGLAGRPIMRHHRHALGW